MNRGIRIISLRELREAQENLLTGIKWNFLLEMHIKMVL